MEKKQRLHQLPERWSTIIQNQRGGAKSVTTKTKKNVAFKDYNFKDEGGLLSHTIDTTMDDEAELNRKSMDAYNTFCETVSANYKILSVETYEQMPRRERNFMLKKMMAGHSVVVFPERR